MEQKIKFHLYDTDSLVRELKAGDIDQDMAFKYLVAGLLLMSIVTVIGTPVYSTLDFVLTLFLFLTTTYFGTKWVYETNKKGDDRDFLLRYTAITFVLGIRLFLFLFLFLLFLGILLGVIGKPGFVEMLSSNAYASFAYNSITLLIYYYFLNKNIKIVSALD